MALEYKMKCNKCGKDMDKYDRYLDFSIRKRLGYGSRYDGDFVRIDLCCDCVDTLIESCKIDPTADTYHGRLNEVQF